MDHTAGAYRSRSSNTKVCISIKLEPAIQFSYRLMEKDNKKAREEARNEYNDAVRVRKRCSGT